MNNQNEVEKMVEFFKDENKLNLVMAQMATANNYGQNGSRIGGPMANANYQQQNNVTGSSVDGYGFTMMAANDNFMHCPPPSNPPHSVESNLAICSPQFDHGYHSLPNSRKSSYNLALTNPPTPHGNLDGAAKPSQMESMSIVDPIRYMAEDDDEEQQKEGGEGTLGHHWESNMFPSKSVGHQLGQMAIGIGSTAGQSRQQHQWMNIMDGGGGDKGGGSNQQQSTSGYCKPDQQITANNYPATLQQQQHHFQPYSPQLLKDYVDSSAWDYWQHLCRQQQQTSQQQQPPFLSSAITAHQQSPTSSLFGQFDQTTFGGQFPSASAAFMPFPSSSPMDQLSPTVAYGQQQNNENAVPPMENATKAKEKRKANGGRLMKVSPMSFKQKQFAAPLPAVCHYQGALDASVPGGQLGGNQTLGNGVVGGEQGQVEMMTTIKEVAKSPIIDFLCDILAMPAVYNHICAFIGPREFLIRDPKIFTQLLNVAKTGPNQKEKSYLQISRALKSFEERKINDLVMMRKVPNKRNQYKFYPDL